MGRWRFSMGISQNFTCGIHPLQLEHEDQPVDGTDFHGDFWRDPHGHQLCSCQNQATSGTDLIANGGSFSKKSIKNQLYI